MSIINKLSSIGNPGGGGVLGGGGPTRPAETDVPERAKTIKII